VEEEQGIYTIGKTQGKRRKGENYFVIFHNDFSFRFRPTALQGFFSTFIHLSSPLLSSFHQGAETSVPCFHANKSAVTLSKRTEVILEASEKISIKRPPCTLLALRFSQKKPPFSLRRQFRTIIEPKWPDHGKSWSNEFGDSLFRKLSKLSSCKPS